MITFNNITKSYGTVKALDGLSLTIEENEIFGFVGATGFGKTTALKIICGILSPTEGVCTVDGLNVSEKTRLVKEITGYVPATFGVFENLKVHEFLNFFASSQGLSGKRKEERCSEILEILGLSEWNNKFVEDLSRNKKKKLGIARAIIHRPKILLFDEPFSDLTMQSKGEVIEILRQLNSLGITIVITSHTLREVSSLCSRVAALEGGRAVITGSLSDIEKRIQENNPIVMRVKNGQEKVIKILKEDERVKNLIISEDEEVIVHFEGGEAEEGELLKRAIFEGALITSFTRKGCDIESMLQKVME